jgi:hypothetical protein
MAVDNPTCKAAPVHPPLGHSGERDGATENSNPSDARNIVDMNLSQALAAASMMMYHWPCTSRCLSARYSEDTLMCVFPFERLLASAARSAPAAYRREVAERVQQLAAMGRLLVATVQQRAPGTRPEDFAWVFDFVWFIEDQIREAQEVIGAEFQSEPEMQRPRKSTQH